MALVVPRNTHAGQFLAVLVTVVGTEQEFAAVSQCRSHVSLSSTAVATIAGRQFVDDLFFGFRRSGSHSFSLGQVGIPTHICNHEVLTTLVHIQRISLTAKGIPTPGGAHDRGRSSELR